MAAAVVESDVCFECGGEFINDEVEHCGGCLCLFHRDCLRHLEKDVLVCSQCSDLMSNTIENEVTPQNGIEIDKEQLTRAPKRVSTHNDTYTSSDSFVKELTLFKLHLLEEEQLLVKKRQQEKEERCREINALKEKQLHHIQSLRDEEISRKEREAAECIARMEKLELEFQKQQYEQDSEFIRRKSLVINNPEADLNLSRPEGSVKLPGIIEEPGNGKKLSSTALDRTNPTDPFPSDQFSALAGSSFNPNSSCRKNYQEKSGEALCNKSYQQKSAEVS